MSHTEKGQRSSCPFCFPMTVMLALFLREWLDAKPFGERYDPAPSFSTRMMNFSSCSCLALY